MSSALRLSPRPRPRPAADLLARRAPLSSPRPKHRNPVAIAVSRGNAIPTELIAVNAATTTLPNASPPITDIVEDAHALIGNPPRSLRDARDLACLAVSIYHEARGEPVLGQRGVAAVIYRRATYSSRWGDTICEVVRPVQFSYLTPDLRFPEITNLHAWRRAVVIAAETLINGPNQRLAGADHYHTVEVAPAWNEEMVVIARIDDHVFLQDGR